MQDLPPWSSNQSETSLEKKYSETKIDPTQLFLILIIFFLHVVVVVVVLIIPNKLFPKIVLITFVQMIFQLHFNLA